MLTVDQKIVLLRVLIHFIVFFSFSIMLNEWALGLAVSAFSRCYINKLAVKSYYFFRKLIASNNT